MNIGLNNCNHITSGSWCKICQTKPEKKKPKPLRKVSVKRVTENKEYTKVREAYLKVFPVCEVLNCLSPSTEIHHRFGKENERLLDINHFLAVCRTCHEYIHNNHAWSIEHGYKELRSN